MMNSRRNDKEPTSGRPEQTSATGLGERKRAVALHYQQGTHSAPRVSASGQGFMAEKLIETARRHGIPIREDKNLVQVLSQLDLNSEIPAELYAAIAELLAFVYRMNEKSRQ